MIAESDVDGAEDYDFEDSGYQYKNTGSNTVSVVGYSGDSTEILIPTEVENGGITYTVTKIGDSAFLSKTRITTVTIPDSVTSIGMSAFQGCTNLASVSISESVETIDYGVFQKCRNLTSVEIPNTVKSIGERAFCDCGLTSIFFGTGITTIDNKAFGICTGFLATNVTPTTFEDEDGNVLNVSNVTDFKGKMFRGSIMKMTQTSEHTLTFKDGDYVVEKRYYSGDRITAPTLTKEGYTFGSWRTDDGEVFDPDTEVMPQEDLTLNATWVVNRYLIELPASADLTVFDANGQSIMNGDEVAYDTELTVEAAERKGYTSKVFLNSEELTGGTFTVGLVNVLTVEYFPESCTVTFDSGLTVRKDGNEIASGAPVDYGTELTVEATEKTGCTSKVFLNGEELTGGTFVVGLVNVLTVEYKAVPSSSDDDDDGSYQPWIVNPVAANSEVGTYDVIVVAVAAVAALFMALGAMVLRDR